ncbi:MAG: UMP kinase [Planctomycetota bacterium]
MPDDPPDIPPDTPHTAPFRRVLLKISGEALSGQGGFGIDPDELRYIAHEIHEASKVNQEIDPFRLRREGDKARAGTEVAVVVGGGNIIRGASLAEQGIVDQAVADQMGMLGTVINALALKEALEHLGQPARVMSALMVSSVAENFIRGRALRHLEKGRVVIFAAGTGNPFSTTDSGASLRASEIDADVVLKATKVDGIYDKDPRKHDDAVRYESISFDEAITRDLKVMDIGSFAQCRENDIPIIVFDMKAPGNIARAVAGEPIGTRVG